MKTEIIRSVPSAAPILTEIAFKAKKHWRYPDDQTTDIRRYIHEKKLEVAKDFHKYFVSFNQK